MTTRSTAPQSPFSGLPLGQQVRLARIFTRGHLFGLAVDHFVSYGQATEGGLADLPGALAQSMAGGPDSVTMTAGTAKHCWPRYAGQAALIVEGASFTPDDRVSEVIATVQDAVRLGADAIAMAVPVRGPTEGRYLRWLTDTVREASPYGLPVVAHIYPRDYTDEPRIVFHADQIAWAVRCGIECGVDVIKVGYPGDQAAFAQIVDRCPTPVVVAGGPKTSTLTDALQTVSDALGAGAVGAVVGRNIWGADDVPRASRAFAGVIHRGLQPNQALAEASGVDEVVDAR
jgi:class I fructose-bisphosphate aldolase